MSSLLDQLIPSRKDTTSKRIAHHERCIELLEAIQSLQNRRACTVENIEGFGGTFPELRRKYKHRLIIIDMAIARIEKMYHNIRN